MAHCPLEVLKKAEQFEETTSPAIDNELVSYNLWQKRHYPSRWKGKAYYLSFTGGNKKLSF